MKVWMRWSLVWVVALGMLPAIAQAQPLDAEMQNSTPKLRLSPDQREAVREATGLAIEQLEGFLDVGLDPSKLDREKMTRNAEKIGQTLSGIRLDQEQLDTLRGILRDAREQIDRQLGSDDTQP
ncbi:MAG TPA: hypothetical protein IGS53_03210 [Leptolyngbyaceae cyanobacterium M33_DOE_097]|uniref:Uncharacterized protein n=1 Tax=Oscillatoriales cyanobacterium SpSt-418 TaxID=2282169 RepID=A0A7C3KAL3_9CYAN|nr:hypothetical protein [Leptolyngbyaceae cyanobacterium M33_DOE_097]